MRLFSVATVYRNNEAEFNLNNNCISEPSLHKLTVVEKGPLKNYVILLGGGGRSPKDYFGIKGGKGTIWFIPNTDKVSKKI